MNKKQLIKAIKGDTDELKSIVKQLRDSNSVHDGLGLLETYTQLVELFFNEDNAETLLKSAKHLIEVTSEIEKKLVSIKENASRLHWLSAPNPSRENAGAASSEPDNDDDDLVTVSRPEKKEVRRHKVPCPPWMTEKEWSKKASGFVGDPRA